MKKKKVYGSVDFLIIIQAIEGYWWRFKDDIYHKQNSIPAKNRTALNTILTELKSAFNDITLIKNLENEKKQLLELLGNKVYNFCKESPEGDIHRELVASFCNEIDGRLAQIEVQRARIAQLDAEMDQVRGGGAPVGGGTKMCPCGHPNADTAKFCAKCGNPF